MLVGFKKGRRKISVSLGETEVESFAFDTMEYTDNVSIWSFVYNIKGMNSYQFTKKE
jgi:hypothetical protein